MDVLNICCRVDDDVTEAVDEDAPVGRFDEFLPNIWAAGGTFLS